MPPCSPYTRGKQFQLSPNLLGSTEQQPACSGLSGELGFLQSGELSLGLLLS